MYAVIRTGGKQYRVAPDEILNIEKISGEVGDVVQISEVLMIGGEGDPSIGSPLIDGASVAAEVIEQGRDKKIIVFKKKRRHNYRRKAGHQQDITTIRITEILTDGKAPKKVKAKKADDQKQADKPSAKTSDTTKAKKASDTEKASETKAEKLFDAPKDKADDLKKISGVGPKLEEKLNALGITTFEQIANFTDEDVARVDEVLNFKGRIEREDWISQAKDLAKDLAKD